ARRIAVGRSITSVTLRHAAQRRTLPARDAQSLVGDTVVAVERRGKSQRFRLASGRQLVIHFRMTGDWLIPDERPLPATVRAVITFDNGARLALDDPRALSVLSLCDAPIEDGMGPDALDRALTARGLARALASRRIPIKVALLDQAIIAGIGNIYAAEALWRARIDPRRPANSIALPRLRVLRSAIRATLAQAIRWQQRYYGSSVAEPTANRFKVYDREGEPCRRCRQPIRRITQAGRSTYFCATCQA
ncbi:MAG TPA: DNA-formamidopyrimidine glycosylase family protein, partial [Gemmatimonadaceae bacterium]